MKKFTPAQKKKLKGYWQEQKEITKSYWEEIFALQETMEKDLKIKGMEFFCINGIVGIGTMDRKYAMLHDTELEGR